MNRVVSLPGRAAGVLVPLVVAALLVPLRETLDRSTMVLLLVVVVVAVATTGDRVAACIAAVVSAASFDFFLTRPYGSLRITSAADIETAVMLLVIGLLVGQIAIFGRRRRDDAARVRDELRVLELVAARIAEEPERLVVVDLVTDQLKDLLDLESCRFGLARPDAPELRPDGTVAVATHRMVDEEFALPDEGVALAVTSQGERLGWLELVPRERTGVSKQTRRAAVALAQQLGAALARAPHSA